MVYIVGNPCFKESHKSKDVINKLVDAHVATCSSTFWLYHIIVNLQILIDEWINDGTTQASPACCSLLTRLCILLSLIFINCSIFCIFNYKIYIEVQLPQLCFSTPLLRYLFQKGHLSILDFSQSYGITAPSVFLPYLLLDFSFYQRNFWFYCGSF